MQQATLDILMDAVPNLSKEADGSLKAINAVMAAVDPNNPNSDVVKSLNTLALKFADDMAKSAEGVQKSRSDAVQKNDDAGIDKADEMLKTLRGLAGAKVLAHLEAYKASPDAATHAQLEQDFKGAIDGAIKQARPDIDLSKLKGAAVSPAPSTAQESAQGNAAPIVFGKATTSLLTVLKQEMPEAMTPALNASLNSNPKVKEALTVNAEDTMRKLEEDIKKGASQNVIKDDIEAVRTEIMLQAYVLKDHDHDRNSPEYGNVERSLRAFATENSAGKTEQEKQADGQKMITEYNNLLQSNNDGTLKAFGAHIGEAALAAAKKAVAAGVTGGDTPAGPPKIPQPVPGQQHGNPLPAHIP